MVCLTEEQRVLLLECFHRSANTDTSAHANVWKKRSYAPMYIYSDEMKTVYNEVRTKYPNHTIAFDVIFESDGKMIDWHVDHESLGPFHVPNRWRAIKNNDFISIHFNLTPNGGSLMTLDSFPILSYICFTCIVYTGIFSTYHRVLTYIIAAMSVFAKVFDNTPGRGNEFDNTRLHAVTGGDPRTSYVLRLVRNGTSLTRQSVMDGISRSTACHAFKPLLTIVDSMPVDAADVKGNEVFCSSGSD